MGGGGARVGMVDAVCPAILEEFAKHAERIRKSARERKKSVELKNVVDDKDEHEAVNTEDTLGKRQPSDVFNGDVNLRTLRELLKMIDARGWERSGKQAHSNCRNALALAFCALQPALNCTVFAFTDHQLQFHSAFERCVSRVLYKSEWATQRPAIMQHNGWTTCNSEVLISTPRRFGKTFS